MIGASPNSDRGCGCSTHGSCPLSEHNANLSRNQHRSRKIRRREALTTDRAILQRSGRAGLYGSRCRTLFGHFISRWIGCGMKQVDEAGRTVSQRRPRKVRGKISRAVKPVARVGSRRRTDAAAKGTVRAKSDQFLVVGIGASAGGLEAVRKLLATLPLDTGMSFVLIQHLDPTHKSMLVDLLARDTRMSVLQAGDGMPIERDSLYVIPAQADLSVHEGMLRFRNPQYASVCTCRSTCSCARWRTTMVSAPWASSYREPAATAASGSGRSARRADLSSCRILRRPPTMACPAAQSPRVPSISCCRRRKSPQALIRHAQHPGLHHRSQGSGVGR